MVWEVGSGYKSTTWRKEAQIGRQERGELSPGFAGYNKLGRGMRLVLFTVAAISNLLFLALAASSVIADGAEWPDRMLPLGLAVALGSVVMLLVLAAVRRVPNWGFAAMRWLTIVVPVLWLLAALDTGRVSGQEIVFLLVSVLVAWGTWYAFRRLHLGAR